MTKNLNMQLPYARATVSISDVVVIHTWASSLYLKNDIWHTAWIFRRILSKWPTVGVMLMQTHATCSWDRALAHLGVTSNLEQIGCVVLLYTWPARASVNPPGARLDPLIKLICNNVWKSVEPHSVMNYSNLIVWLIIIGLMYGAQLRVWTIYWVVFLEASTLPEKVET